MDIFLRFWWVNVCLHHAWVFSSVMQWCCAWIRRKVSLKVHTKPFKYWSSAHSTSKLNVLNQIYENKYVGKVIVFYLIANACLAKQLSCWRFRSCDKSSFDLEILVSCPWQSECESDDYADNAVNKKTHNNTTPWHPLLICLIRGPSYWMHAMMILTIQRKRPWNR